MQQLKRLKKLLFNGIWYSTFEGIAYQRTGLSVRARFNIILQNLSNFIRPSRSLGIPYCITVEPASICNLNCPVCPSGMNKTIRNPSLLPLTAFKALIDDIGEYLVLIQMWEWGEPFMNPAIYEMIAYAKKRGIIVMSSTNCHFFNDDISAQKLIDSQLDGLILAVDGATKETYEQYRIGGDFERIMAGIKRVVSAKKNSGSRKPLLNFRMVVNAFNEHQIEAFTALGEALAVDQIAFKTINIGMGGEQKNQEILPQAKSLIREKSSRDFQYNCKVAWCNPVLFSNGLIGLCGLACQGETELQQISPANTFSAIWNCDDARTFRKNIKADCNHYLFCRQCDCREPDYNRSRFGEKNLTNQ